MQAQVRPNTETIEQQKQHKACFVLGTNIDASQLHEADVIAAYKGQAHVEGGFRFLKDPLFFVSSLFVKKTLSYPGTADGDDISLTRLCGGATPTAPAIGATQRDRTQPNSSTHTTANPLRWAFQLWEGIHRVHVTVQGQVHDLFEGLTEVKLKVLRLFGEGVCRLYQISPA
jgi:hypothetical protein